MILSEEEKDAYADKLLDELLASAQPAAAVSAEASQDDFGAINELSGYFKEPSQNQRPSVATTGYDKTTVPSYLSLTR